MTDIAVKFDNDLSEFYISLLNDDFVSDEGLETACLISLFSDRRCTDDELPSDEESKRGWWADAVQPELQDQTGSKLWLLDREKTTNETLTRAEEYSLDALQWLIDDGIASSIDVTTSYIGVGIMLIEINITRPQGQPVNYKFNYTWEGQANAV